MPANALTQGRIYEFACTMSRGLLGAELLTGRSGTATVLITVPNYPALSVSIANYPVDATGEISTHDGLTLNCAVVDPGTAVSYAWEMIRGDPVAGSIEDPPIRSLVAEQYGLKFIDGTTLVIDKNVLKKVGGRVA